MSDDPRPSHRYYRAMRSAWRGKLSLAITDPAALAAAPLGMFDRQAWRSTAFSERILGQPWFETRVDYASGAAKNEVVHETRRRSLGVPLVSGVEIITLDPDGRRFTMRGRHRFAWAPWTTRAVDGMGEVREDESGAVYDFEYFGARVAQVTRREGEDVLVATQTTAFGRSEVHLERQPGTR